MTEVYVRRVKVEAFRSRQFKSVSETLTCIPRGASLFFEEKHHLEFLAKTIVTDLKAGASLGRSRHIRIWNAACSTGEEAYSIAISLLDALPASEPWRIEIVATDTDSVLLETAMERIYDEASLGESHPDLKTRYFLRGRGEMSGRVRVKQRVANLIRFQRLRLETRPWSIEGKFDAIFFRSALDSFHPEIAERILRHSLLYLKPHAYLVLGSNDQASWLKDAVISVAHGIHQLRPHGKARYTGDERRIFLRKPLAPE
jgi:chemotaxis protein methyltransferase CheR